MNSANTKLQDPSMDDILASIRKIISEDQTSPSVRMVPSGAKPSVSREGAAETPRVQPIPFPIREEAPASVSAAVSPASVSASAAPAPSPGLVSEGAQSAVTGAFARLAATPVPPPIRGLEEAVTEMLRPMLRTWLDDNLPSLVERLVKAEIERLTRNAR